MRHFSKRLTLSCALLGWTACATRSASPTVATSTGGADDATGDVRDNAIHDPSPNTARLAMTEAAEMQHPVTVTINYCIDHEGRVVDQTVTESSGDQEVDQICLETLDFWRYRPFIVDGKPMKTCTSVTFNLNFE
jgi:periplasmic protein TonB